MIEADDTKQLTAFQKYYRNLPAEDRRKLIDRNARKEARRRHWLGLYQTKKGCLDCGYNRHSAALQFDHLNPSKKLFSVSRIGCRSLKNVFSEVRKCRVLCANCHAIHTYREYQRRKNNAGANPPNINRD